MEFRNKNEESQTINLHEGHRARLRQRLADTNFVNADEYEVIEYVLQLVVRRKDTNPLAHKLVLAFGSLANVCDASVEDLMQVDGVSQTVAEFLHNIPNIFRNYKLSKQKPKANLSCPQDIFNYLGECIYHLPREEFYVVCLDGSNNVINQKLIAIGNNTQVSLKLVDAVRFAMQQNAKKVVLLHNHPSGSANPSEEDIETTKKFFSSFITQGIMLDDHLIVNYQGKYFSFAHAGLIDRFKKLYSEYLNKNV